MASAGVIWGPDALRLLRAAVSKTTAVVRDKLANAAKPFQNQALQPIPVSAKGGRQSIHPAALAKQQVRGARGFSTNAVKNANKAVRRYLSSESSAPRLDRSKLPSSNTSRRVSQFSGRAPFASALRPNLTGGAMPRTAGGYSLGGGARYFSHTPTAPAQVVQNVSQAMRAFFLSGQRIRYDGTGPRGEAQYRAVSVLEDEAMRKLAAIPKFAPGAYIDFQLSPTITAMSPLAAALVQASGTSGFQAEAAIPSLNTEGFLDVLSADFGRALKDLTAIYADLERLSALGDLPISLELGNLLRVRFPGVDVETLERLCDDIGIQRGIVSQDIGFESAAGVRTALKFPFAPDAEKALTSPGGSERSLEGHELEDDMSSLGDESFVHEAFAYENSEDPWYSETDGYESMSPPNKSEQQCSEEYEGLEGIYRFLEECDKAKGRLG
ncbi:hypothetical protein TrVFT333_005354 [Trichoderma virens FT-333]|nr:hypothetical protein TrVFT333_005354 [Trichoderma virens FT-333]